MQLKWHYQIDVKLKKVEWSFQNSSLASLKKALSEQLSFPSSVYFNSFTLLIVHDPSEST